MDTGTSFDFTSIFAGLQDTITGALSGPAKIGVVVGGIVLAIGLGWKLVKRFTGR